MVHDQAAVKLDGIDIAFDDERAVSNAGALLAVGPGTPHQPHPVVVDLELHFASRLDSETPTDIQRDGHLALARDAHQATVALGNTSRYYRPGISRQLDLRGQSGAERTRRPATRSK